jgi:GNAT superfamily N-acetyltransferase
MKIRDLTPKDKDLYCVCLEDWSEEMMEAGNHKANWYEKMKDKGLRVKLAEDDNGEIGGMIQYVPIEYSFAEGEDAYIVLCIWVHGYKEGRGDFRKQGMGKALLKAAEEDAKSLGAKGLAAWGMIIPVFMQASWFKKRGYKVVDKIGIQALLWKPFEEGAKQPKMISRKKKPVKIKGQVTVDAFKNGWCPASNLTFERAKRASAEFGDKVVF